MRPQGIAILLTDHNVRETLKITDRSYQIKDGTVRTHGTPYQIVHDPVAISEYLGAGFHDDPFSRPEPAVLPAVAPPPPAVETLAPSPQQEKLQRLVEKLRTGAAAEAAAELVQHGQEAVGVLLEALDRRDVELRRQALNILQTILPGGVVFDPYAPESLRKQQLTDLREQFFRKAG